MEHTEETIAYQLEAKENENIEIVLQNTFNSMMTKLKKEFGNDYTISSNDFSSSGDEWTNSIKIRKGNKVGASIDLNWKKTSPSDLILEVDESSKMGSIVTYGILIPFLLIGAYLGYNHISPLAFLPGYKIAAGLGGLIAVIPGAIFVAILKSILLKNEKEENKKLVNEVRKAVMA